MAYWHVQFSLLRSDNHLP